MVKVDDTEGAGLLLIGLRLMVTQVIYCIPPKGAIHPNYNVDNTW